MRAAARSRGPPRERSRPPCKLGPCGSERWQEITVGTGDSKAREPAAIFSALRSLQEELQPDEEIFAFLDEAYIAVSSDSALYHCGRLENHLFFLLSCVCGCPRPKQHVGTLLAWPPLAWPSPIARDVVVSETLRSIHPGAASSCWVSGLVRSAASMAGRLTASYTAAASKDTHDIPQRSPRTHPRGQAAPCA